MCISKLSYEEEATIFTALCPLTYRGYNYDFTTGLYYLQSRYYNPEWGRFLNCDDTAILLATQGETHNANLFAYCNNNPVNRVDKTGYYSIEMSLPELDAWLTALILGIKILEKSGGYEYLLKQELAGFFYDINKYNLIIFRFAFYDKSAKKEYSTIKFVAGFTVDWVEYANYENERYTTLNELGRDMLSGTLDDTTDNLLNGGDAQSVAIVAAGRLAFNGIVYGTGRLVVSIINHDDAVEKVNEQVSNGDLIIGFEEVESYKLPTTALIAISSDSLPKKFERVKVF